MSAFQLGSPSGKIKARYHEQLKQIYGEERPGANIHGQGLSDEIDHINNEPLKEEYEEAYEFPLFAKSPGSHLAVNEEQKLQRIVLRSYSPANSEPSFVRRLRPEKHYFTGVTSAEMMEQFRLAAVSGDRIIEGLNQRWVRSHWIEL